MTEYYQDFNVYFYKTSKEARDDFIKYYLDNIDQFMDYNHEVSNNDVINNTVNEEKPYKILDCKNYTNDHNASVGLIKPQFSFLYPTYRLSIMVDLTQSMLWTTGDGEVKLEKGLEILKEILQHAVQKKYEIIQNVIVNVFCFKNARLTVIIKGWELQVVNFDEFYNNIIQEIYKNVSSEIDKYHDNMFNILREGIVSLNLFEKDNKSTSNLLIITDANFPVPDGLILDKLILMLRFCSISCSFIHIKSDYELTNFSSITDQSNEDQLKFIANVSGGFYCSFKDLGLLNEKYILSSRSFDQMEYLYSDTINLKHFNEKVFNVPPLTFILSLINSGYFLNSINILRDSRCEIELQLPWRVDIYFRAIIVTKLPMDQYRKCTLNLSICAPSYFHQRICKNSINNEPDVNIQRFSTFLSETKTFNFFMESFSQFNTKPMFTVPNFINNGLKPMLSPTNQPCDKIDKIPKAFFDFWKRTLDLEYLICLHTTKINLLIEHDYPFPEYLSSPDPLSNKYSQILCREGLVQLSTLINKNFCSFIVKENSTFVKFFSTNSDNMSDQNPPNHFCVIKLLIKDFEVKIFLYFFIYTPESIRNEFVTNLTNAIRNLKFPPRGKRARPRHMSSQMAKKMDHVPPQQRSWEQINCCIVLNLDLDNLIATYNPIKSIDSNKRVIRQQSLSLSMIYLLHQCHHEYRFWSINSTFMKNIFETLIKVRLQEGFHFAYSDSSSGFINLVKEIKLLNNSNQIYNCFIQYMIYFDSRRQHHDSDNVSNPDDLYGLVDKYSSNTTLKLFIEILIEKKAGIVTNCEPEIQHWNGLTYQQVPKEIIDLDLKCLETFVTFECFQIYPATLRKSLVKPNICSVLNNSSRVVLNCPLYCDESAENFKILNTVFMEILDRNLKFYGFSNIDITKTENTNFNDLLSNYRQSPSYGGLGIIWHCYYTMKSEYLIVVMLPSNYLDCKIDNETTMKTFPLFVYGMSLKHLSFLIEDRWTLKLPKSVELTLPISQTNNKPASFLLETQMEIDENNEFAQEIDHIQSYLMKSVKKLDSIYVLTFVAGIHKNLRENRSLNRDNLSSVFQDYCSELSFYDVDGTRFMNTICSHCSNALQMNSSSSSTQTATMNLNSINKEQCEMKSGMHIRIVKRIRMMMAKYFKEVPSFPQILIYCPENEIESIAEFNETSDNELMTNFCEEAGFMSFNRQLSQEHQLIDSEMSNNCPDSISELDAKSISSIALINQNNCPLFISINYTLKYGEKQKYMNFDTIPTCISDFIEEIKSIADGDVNFEKLKFHLDMIPITVVDEDLHNDVIKMKNDNYSLIADGKGSSKKTRQNYTKSYLTPFQIQLLNNCKTELIWTLDDEVVNCYKYLNTIDQNTIEMVMGHIDSSLQHKWYKSYSVQIQKKLFDLEFVFGFEKSKTLFQERFERLTFGKHDQYKLEKIGDVYCVFQKVKLNDDQSALGLGLFPDQIIADIDDVFISSRIRYETMCFGSLNRTSDNASDHQALKRSCSDSKLTYRSHSRNMSSEPPERQSFLLMNTEKFSIPNATETIKPVEFRQITNLVSQSNVPRQVRSPMPYLIQQQSINITPKRHRSGEASSTIFTGNNRSDTPMLLNGLISTATSSKGYEADSSLASEAEEYDVNDHFSNSLVDNKIDNIKSEMAPFWIILDIVDQQKQIEIYFHHTDNCWLTVPNLNFPICDHCNAFESIFEKFKACVHQVNQCLLLEKLAQSRICRDILVPEECLDQKISSMSQLLDYDYDDESFEFSKKFAAGAFACPKILKITFRLHSRLRTSTDKNAKAIPLLRSGLENIAVLNRKNMLIFVDDNTKGIFYCIMKEINGNLDQEELDRLNENSVLISDSNNYLTKTVKVEELILPKHHDNLDTLSIKSAPSFSDSKSNNKSFNSSMSQSGTVELLELSVHGVDNLSKVTRTSIISNIGSKLDLIVLRKFSESICRSRAISLNKDDIDFLLSEDFNNKPQKPKSFSWSLPKLVKKNKLAFCYYLKQNLQFGFISPKIADPALLERLHLNPESIGEVYLYNQTSAQGIANEVIALFTLQLMNGPGKTSCVIKDSSFPEFQLGDAENLEELLSYNHPIELENLRFSEFTECYLHFNLWIRGIINVDSIKKKIVNAIQHSLNDLFMEYAVIPCPISFFDEDFLKEIRLNINNSEKIDDLDLKISGYENGSIGNLNSLFAENVFQWIPDLSKNECPLLKYRSFEMFSDFNVEFLINDLIESMNEFLHLKIFQYDGTSWTSWNAKFPRSGKEYPGIKRSFIIIGRLEELWKRFVKKRFATIVESDDISLSNSQTSLSLNSNLLGSSINSTSSNQHINNVKELRKVRILLKQPPLDYNLMNASNSQTNSSNSYSGMPEFCNVRVSNSVIIPRQTLCIIKIHGCRVETIVYNLAKEIFDHLYGSVDNILKHHKSRFQMMNLFIYQKLGLFYECSSRSCLQTVNITSVKGFLHSAPVNKVKSVNSSINDLNRERKASGSSRSFSPHLATNKTLHGSQSKSSSKQNVNKSLSININLSRIYQDAYSIYEIKTADASDVIYQHTIQFLNTYQLEYRRRLLSKKIRQSISFLQPTSGFKQTDLSEMDCPIQQLDIFSSLKRACRIFHSVACPILFYPNVRKKILKSQTYQSCDKNDKDGNNSHDDWIHEIGRLILAHYADYVEKEHGFQFLNPPRPNMSQNPGSHALFQKLSNNSGIQLLEVFVIKDCLCVRLNLLEIRRLNSSVLGSGSSLNSCQLIQNMQKTFVKDACKFCDLTHLVSFMYDMYLRKVAKSISYPDENKKPFNPISFLRDLVSIYTQPPLYATSHVYLMPFPVPHDVIKPDILFEFLQRHFEDYNFLIYNNSSNESMNSTNTSFLYNKIDDRCSSPKNMNFKKVSPSASSPLEMIPSDSRIYYKHVENANNWNLTSIFCLTRSLQDPGSSFDLFIITLNQSICFPHQRLLTLEDKNKKSSTFLSSYLTILPHNSSNPANLLHLNPSPISSIYIDTTLMPKLSAWRTYNNRSVVPLQAPLFLTLKYRVEKYLKESNEKFAKAITDCHKDSLWHRMYQQSEITDSTKFSLTFEEFQDLINSGSVVDILELDNRLTDSMKIAASYLKELNDYMGKLSDDCYTVLYENTTSIYRNINYIVSNHLVLLSKKTTDGFLLLSKNQELNSSPDSYSVQLRAVFRTQDCRNRVPLQHKYFTSSLRDITVMLAETAAFCIWRKLAMKPINYGK